MYEQIAANRRKTIILIIAFFILIIGLGYGLALYYGNSSILIIAIIISIAMNWWSYFNGDKTILAVSKAKPVDPEQNLSHRRALHIVENLAITAGLPCPQLYIINDSAPNAFATGRDSKHASIALTSGIIDKLDKTELEGVIAHELSHIKNQDILLATVVVTLLGAIVLISDWTLRTRSVFGKNRRNNNVLAIIGLVLMILSPILSRLIYFAISRKREYLADASGALLTRYPEGLASALKKISADENQLKTVSQATAGLYILNPFKKKLDIDSLFSTHPPIEKRIQALNNMNV